MNVLVSGATGLVGTALCDLLRRQEHTVYRLTRRKARQAGDIEWDPLSPNLDAATLPPVEGVVHLAGENIAGRWTEAKKKAIRDSRAIGTHSLCEALTKMPVRPRRLVSASAIGLYGQRGDEILVEESAPGTGFLPDVCKEWENATEPASRAGISVVHARLGVVLSDKGGALAQMLTPFTLGVGGVMGSGTQYMSWLTLDEAARALSYLLSAEQLTGAVNVTSPNPVTNREFTKRLGKVLHRPTILPMPAFAARLAFGAMADDLLLGSTRVVPAHLLEAGYTFIHPELEPALRSILKK